MNALSGLFVAPARAAEVTIDRAPAVFATLTNWDQRGLASLRAHAGKIDVLVPEWLALGAANGAVTEKETEQTTLILELISVHNPDLRIAPLINNFTEGKWQGEWMRQAISTPDSRARLIAALYDYVQVHNHAGITIQFEGLRPEDAAAYEDFARDLYGAFNSAGLAVYHVASMQSDVGSPSVLAAYSDAIIVLSQGETSPVDAPGPLASQDWYATELTRWFGEVPADKLVIGISNLAMDWDAGAAVGTPISVISALHRAQQYGAQPLLDPTSLNTHFAYQDTRSSQHTVWMLDGVSAFNHLQALLPYTPHGVALQRLGLEDPSVWALLGNMNNLAANSVSNIDASYQIQHAGTGEITTLARLPQPGTRDLTLSSNGTQITASTITQFPNSYEIAHHGATDEKLIALTFDDGPNALYTPQILDALSEYGVPATFFSVGANMLKYPDLIKRMVAEGHEVGSHTYSHLNISAMSPDVLRFELNATQSVFESITGRNLTLFRAPYATDTNPILPDEVAPLAIVSALGYLVVNMNIDPRDWWLARAERIAQATVRGAHAGLGNVVLLHDSGGNRSETARALPMIIEQLRADGFRFVPVSELLGLTSELVMPRSQADTGLLRTFEAAGFAVLREGQRLLAALFVIAITLGITRAVILVVLSFVRRPKRLANLTNTPKVGVVVPAYNEEKVILKTVHSLLGSRYENLEIIIVDDGSTDSTYALCLEHFAQHENVRVVTQANAGKSVALNHGFELLESDIVVALDADTVFLEDTISRLVVHFDDPQVAAVSGNAKVGNRHSLLTRWQALEYVASQNLDRRAFDALNCISVVPGAVGAWRKHLVIAAGGYTSDTLAEDADLTLRLLRMGYRITYEEHAIALTEAPQTIRQFVKQRFRWMFGMMQIGFKHFGALKLQDSKSVGLIAIPNIIIFQVIFPLMAPVADLVAIGALIDLCTRLITQSELVNLSGTLGILALFFVFILVDFMAAVIAFWHEKTEDWTLLLWLVPQRFFYRQLIYLVAIQASFAALSGAMVGWGNLTRTASVSVPAKGR